MASSLLISQRLPYSLYSIQNEAFTVMPVRRSQNTRSGAKNTRLVDTALRTIDNLLDANRQNVANAIEATGFPVTIYNRMTSGRPCTCKQHRAQLMDAKGNLGASVIDTLVTGDDSGIEPYHPERPYSQTWDERTTVVDSFHPNNDPTIPSTEINLIGGMGDPMLDDEEDVATSMDLDLDTEDGGRRLYIGNNTSCGVCFGTSFVGGYDLLFGSRHICDASADHTIEGAELDAVAAPNAFVVYEGGHVKFDVMFPAAIPFILYPRVFNNKKPLPLDAFVLEHSADNGNTWTELSTDNLRVLCIGLPGLVRIKPPKGVSELTFTHIEFLFSTRDRNSPAKADFPEINKSLVRTMADAVSNSNIIIPGDIIMNRGSIVIDHLPGLSRHWMMGTITPRRDQRGNVYDVSADARVIDINELGHLLRPLILYNEPLV